MLPDIITDVVIQMNEPFCDKLLITSTVGTSLRCSATEGIDSSNDRVERASLAFVEIEDDGETVVNLVISEFSVNDPVIQCVLGLVAALRALERGQETKSRVFRLSGHKPITPADQVADVFPSLLLGLSLHSIEIWI